MSNKSTLTRKLKAVGKPEPSLEELVAKDKEERASRVLKALTDACETERCQPTINVVLPDVVGGQVLPASAVLGSAFQWQLAIEAK